jgi:hypothetical protein
LEHKANVSHAAWKLNLDQNSKETTMNVSDLYPSRYLKASDLDGPVVFIIDSLTTEEVGKDKEIKPVIRFRGVQKPFILNRTNANAIAKIYGGNTSTWIGKPVQLYPTVTEAGGEQYDVIRFRAPPGAAPASGLKAAAAQPYNQAPLGPESAATSQKHDEIPF